MGLDTTLFVHWRGTPFSAADIDTLGTRLAAEVEGIQFYFTKPPLSLAQTVGTKRADLRASGVREPRDRAWRTAADDAPYTPFLVGGSGDQIIEVNIEERYFGADYPRGRWPLIAATIDWLEASFPGGTIWYGGDYLYSARPLTALRRTRMTRLYERRQQAKR